MSSRDRPPPPQAEGEESEGSESSDLDLEDDFDPSNSPRLYKGGQRELRIEGSRVEYYGCCVNICGYCKTDSLRPPNRRSYDMKAYRLMATDYQLLLDKGWRRCGNYCYHPVNKNTCCPNYAISCKASKFRLSRSQRRCIENLNSFLINGTTRSKAELDYAHGQKRTESRPLSEEEFQELKESSKARHRRFVRSCERKVKLHDIDLEEAIRRVRTRRNKNLHSTAELEDYLYPKKTILETQPNPQHRLVIRLDHVESKANRAMRYDEYHLMKRYQESIHGDGADVWPFIRFRDFLLESPLVGEPIRDRSYITANNHNRVVNDRLVQDVSDGSEYLLVKPPELPTTFGTYHCTYHLDGVLIAVGVLDILPKCITTVYFFWDPNYAHLNLGNYSALVEIAMVRQMATYYNGPAGLNELVHYYMGFYINDCEKMRYKTRFLPSYLLCSETCQFVPTEICREKLKDNKYARFCMDPSNSYDIFNETVSIEDIFSIPVLEPVVTTTSMLDYIRWMEKNLGTEQVNILINNFLVQYARLVGRPLLSKMNLQLNSIHNALVRRKLSSRPQATTDGNNASTAE